MNLKLFIEPIRSIKIVNNMSICLYYHIHYFNCFFEFVSKSFPKALNNILLNFQNSFLITFSARANCQLILSPSVFLKIMFFRTEKYFSIGASSGVYGGINAIGIFFFSKINNFPSSIYSCVVKNE